MTPLSKTTRNAWILAPVALFPFALLGALFLFRGTGQKRAIADPAIYLAQSSPQVAAQIGLPISPGWPVRGSLLEHGRNGNADLKILLRGSLGTGMLTEWAQRGGGKWRICSLEFASAHQPALLLVDPAKTHCQPE